jgi:hypothetical protein
MTKKIQLKTNFSLHSRLPGAFELPPSVNTIAELLRQIGKEADFVFIDARGLMPRRDVEVVINGRDISFLPSGLSTILSDGDSVDITLMPLGGG